MIYLAKLRRDAEAFTMALTLPGDLQFHHLGDSPPGVQNTLQSIHRITALFACWLRLEAGTATARGGTLSPLALWVGK